MVNVIAGLLVIIVVACCCIGGVEGATRPHILLVIADDYGFNDIGYHGSEIPTPNLDSLAAAGVKLENYYVQPVCTPARAALLTGRYPIRYGLSHGVLFPPEPFGLNTSETTLAEILREAGYQTHQVGKWHLGFYKWEHTPLYRGFDTSFGYYNGAEDYFNHSQSYPAGGMTGFDFRKNNIVYKESIGQYSTTLFTRHVESIVTNFSKDDPPLFIYMAFQATHDPVESPGANFHFENCSKISNQMRRNFCSSAAVMDQAIGNITLAFQKAGIWNDTLMIFTSDNGGLPNPPGCGNNYPLRGGKFTLWEGGVRGVSFIHGPMVPNPGSVNKQMMHIVDWVPTIASVLMINTSVPGKEKFPLDGNNMWDSLTKDTPSPRTVIVHNIDPLSNTSAIRVGDWKLILGEQIYTNWIEPPTLEETKEYIEPKDPNDSFVYLFNITADPNERVNLAAANADIVTKLQLLIATYTKQMVVPAWPPADPLANPTLHDGAWTPWSD